MQPQVPLTQLTVDDLVNSCQEMVEFRLPKTVWVRFMNEGIMDLYDVLFIEAKTILTRVNETGDFILPDNFKQVFSIGLIEDDEEINDYILSDKREPFIWDDMSKKPYDYIYANAPSSGTYSIFDGALSINNYTGKTIELKYFRKPTFLVAMSTTVNIDIPNEYIEAVKLYACAQAMKAEDETDRYNIFYASYRTKKEELRKYANRYRPERKLYWRVRR